MRKFPVGTGLCLLASILVGCTSYPPLASQDSAAAASAAASPRILSVSASPNIVEIDLSHRNGAVQPIEVRAEVRETLTRVAEVRLVFVEAPIEIPMERRGQSVWSVVLTPDRIRQLSVPGQSTVYRALVIVRDEKGRISMGDSPLKMIVETVGRPRSSG